MVRQGLEAVVSELLEVETREDNTLLVTETGFIDENVSSLVSDPGLV